MARCCFDFCFCFSPSNPNLISQFPQVRSVLLVMAIGKLSPCFYLILGAFASYFLPLSFQDRAERERLDRHLAGHHKMALTSVHMTGGTGNKS